MFDKKIISADYETEQLQGGTIGDVKLIFGICETADREKLPYKIVLKIHKKFERPGDLNSWRREYDLAVSGFGKIFDESDESTDKINKIGKINWAECYRADLIETETENQIELWLEYIDGVSGYDLTVEMLETAAEEFGRFQGRLYKNPEILHNIGCMNKVDIIEKEYAQWESSTVEYCYLYEKETDKFEKYNIDPDGIKEVPGHLKKMLTDIDDNIENLFKEIKKLPVVLCHRDFWIENIFYSDKSGKSGGKIKLIDWDGAGWGYMGEDLASLVLDDVKTENLHENYRRLVPAYFKGISEYIDISAIDHFYIWEMMVIKFGYRELQRHMFAKSGDKKREATERMQKIYEMKNIKI